MQTAINPVPTTQLVLSVVRRNIMQRMASVVFTFEERVCANHSVHQCEDEAKLLLWHRNVCRVELERAATQPPTSQALFPNLLATMAQRVEIVRLCSYPAVPRCNASTLLVDLQRLTYSQATAALSWLMATIWAQDEDAVAYDAQLALLLDSTGILHAHSPAA